MIGGEDDYERARDKLVADAAEASEVFGDDELERSAAVRDTTRALAGGIADRIAYSTGDAAEIARFRYFLRIVRSRAPSPAGPGKWRIDGPELRPLQLAWIKRYATGRLHLGGLR